MKNSSKDESRHFYKKSVAIMTKIWRILNKNMNIPERKNMIFEMALQEKYRNVGAFFEKITNEFYG